MRSRFEVLGIVCAGLLAAGLAADAAAAKAPRALTVYTVASGQQYLNHGDDRIRGALDNPFDTQTSKLRPAIDQNGDAASESGPYAGDVVVYSFDLYGSPKLRTRLGEAAYLCYFNYNARALCMAYYELAHDQGTLVASGPVDFDEKDFTLVVTGGTGKYAGTRGEVASTGSTINAQRVHMVLLDKLEPGSTPASRPEKLTVHSLARTAQFINHADDRLRGMGTNPFNVKSQNLVIVTEGTEKAKGPFPGDDVLYTYELYKGAKLGTPDGSALFTCYYSFAKRATCHSYFKLGKDSVLASGSVPFDSNRFALSITGGTGKYRGARGQVNAAPAKSGKRLDFRLSIWTK